MLLLYCAAYEQQFKTYLVTEISAIWVRGAMTSEDFRPLIITLIMVISRHARIVDFFRITDNLFALIVGYRYRIQIVITEIIDLECTDPHWRHYPLQILPFCVGQMNAAKIFS